MGRHAQLGVLVHFAGADLHFQGAAILGPHGGVQRAVVVALGLGDVIVELAGHRRPQLMHQAQGGVAVLHLLDDDAQGAHVVHLAEVQVLGAHLVPDAVDVLGPAVHLRHDADGSELALQGRHRIGDEGLALDAALFQHLGDALVGAGFEKAEGEILQLPLELPDAEPVGERRVDVEAFAGEVGPLRRVVFRQPAQGADARRQTQQHDADVLHHRQQHLAQHFGLRLHLTAGAGQHPQRRQTFDTVHQHGHRGAKALRQNFAVLRQIGGNVEQQGRQPGIQIEALPRQDHRHGEAVGQYRLIRTQQPLAVMLTGKFVRRLQPVAGRRVEPRRRHVEGGCVVFDVGKCVGDGDHGIRRVESGLRRRRQRGSPGMAWIPAPAGMTNVLHAV